MRFDRLFLPAAVAGGAAMFGLFVAALPAEETSPKRATTAVDGGEARSVIREALSEFNGLIGGWRGAGQVKRGSAAGGWQENGTFVWKFDQGSIGIRLTIEDGPQIRDGVFSYDPDAKVYTLSAVFADDVKRSYRGKLVRGVLTLESEPDADDMVSRITLRQLNEKRTLLLYETRRSSQSFYQRVGEVGYTREGTRLAASDNTGPECVVTGGAGTITVSHAGKTYYVCCTGCRDAFNEDPEGILAAYKEDLAERAAKLNGKK